MAEDDFPFDDAEDDATNEGDTVTPAADDNKSFKQLRDHAKKLERDLARERKDGERLRAFEAEVLEERRTKTVTSVFKDADIDPSRVTWFKADNPDVDLDSITLDDVKSWAETKRVPTSAGEVPEAPVSEPAGFNPVVTGTGSPGGTQSADDIEDLLKKGDLDAVRRAFESGRVNKQAPWTQYQG